MICYYMKNKYLNYNNYDIIQTILYYLLLYRWIYMKHKKQENTISTKITNGKIKKHIDINGDKFETYSNLPTN